MDAYDVILSQEAEKDIRKIIRYLAVDLGEPNTADKMLHRLEDEIKSLRVMPERYALVADADLAAIGVRAISVGNYLMFYTVNRGAHRVNILRVQHGRRNWSEILYSTSQ